MLLGPSGCGKSSLLKCVAGFLKPAARFMRLNGQMITGAGPARMMVFQDFDQLMPRKTVLENVMFPILVSRRFPRPVARERALASITKVKLGRFADVYRNDQDT